MAEAAHHTLGEGARAVRLAAAAAVLGGLLYGTVAGGERLFPLGPMTQYAFYVDPDGEVASTLVEADTTAGTRVRVNLGEAGTGIRRAIIEGNLPAILADPSLLRAVATAQRRRNPEEPQFTRLYVVQEVTPLRDGEVLDPERRVLVTWDVPG